IFHRGPDDVGMLVRGEIGLGMRRLSFIYVAGGNQPIFNEDGSLAIVFNGEIYNYRVLTDELQKRGHSFSNRSDTETIVHLYEEYGVDCVKHLRGMFAFALYDISRRRLVLARDRIGIKPLYYWSDGRKFLFGSEIKAILAYEGVPRQPNLQAVDAYLGLRYVPGPMTLFEGIYKVPAGHVLVWEDGQFILQQYWEPPQAPETYHPDAYYQEQFDALFAETIEMHLMSEVPLGAFLSSGVDSTSIVTTMSRFVSHPVSTFSVGFGWQGDELAGIHALTGRLNVNPYEIICQPQDMALLPKIVWHLDEPVGDAIVLPMYLLAKLAREQVKVVLSGEGADEILAGYFPHRIMQWSQYYSRWMPRFLQTSVIPTLTKAAPVGLLNLAFDYPTSLGKRGKQKLLDYLALVQQKRMTDEYHFLLFLFDERDKTTLYTPLMQQPQHHWQPARSNGRKAPFLDQVLNLQYAHWLPDDILTKADKMSMAHSVEGRVPFMDHELVEFVMCAPPHFKLRFNQNKRLLRKYLQKHLPPEIAKRPKKAFYIPLEQYLNTSVPQEMLAECLSESSIKRRGYFDPAQVKALRDRLDVQDFIYGKQVLALLMLELWHRIFIDQESGWI
ncbi:MAG: asparagine synthase (glutamine-hydrolyzing), partial [Anaerolineae bacterium]|nr:asparagine synthase (glutamine-hydrolyzing) [Anaerolineae bacterium]